MKFTLESLDNHTTITLYSHHPIGEQSMVKPKRQSRPQRWAEAEAASKAVGALEKLQAVTDLDIESAVDLANEADGVELPLGFGRD